MRLMLCLGATALASLLINLGTFHHIVHADGLLPVVMSLQKWTPFLWGQDRLGTPMVLLASPIRNPVHNLLVQGGVMVWLAFLGFPWIARLMGLREHCVAIGVLVAALMLGMLEEFYLYDLLWIEPYAQSFFLGSLGLLLIGGWGRMPWTRSVVGVVCVFLAHYLNLGLVLALFPLAVFRAVLPIDPDQPARGWRDRLTPPMAVAACFAVSLVCSKLTDAPHEPYAPRPLAEWPAAYAGVAGAMARFVPRRLVEAGGALLAVGVVGMLWPSVPGVAKRRAALALGCLGVAALSHFLILTTSRHIVVYEVSARYSYTSVFLVLVGLSSFALPPWLARVGPRGRAAVDVMLLLAVVGIAAQRYGRPSVSGVAHGLRVHSGALADEIVAARANFLVGDYWKVYPAAFLANLELYEQRQPRRVWAITDKSEANRSAWAPVMRPGAVYASFLGDEQLAAVHAHRFHLPPLQEVARTEHLRVMTGPPAAQARRAGPAGVERR